MTAGGPERGAYHRLFYALWPDTALRQAIAAATADTVRQAGGRPVPASHFHLTLAFLGMVPGRRFVDLIAAGGKVRGDPVEILFDRIEYWPRPKVLVMLATTIPPAGQALVDALWERLEPLGFERESRPWQPHLTLARRFRRPPPTIESTNLRPGTFQSLALVESESAPRGVRYRAIAEWPLGRGLSHPLA